MFGLGKPRTKFGKWIDKERISQRELESITGINKNTATRLCNDTEYKPYEETIVKVVGSLRTKRGKDVSIDDFW